MIVLATLAGIAAALLAAGALDEHFHNRSPRYRDVTRRFLGPAEDDHPLASVSPLPRSHVRCNHCHEELPWHAEGCGWLDRQDAPTSQETAR